MPDEDNMVSDDLEKLHIHKEGESTQQSICPGSINDGDYFDKLLTEDVFLKHP
jgi:hypothetical protein